MAKTKKVITEKTEVSKSTYTFENISYSDGTTTFRRINDGFNIFELLGLVKIAESELLALPQRRADFRPDVIEPKVYRSPNNPHSKLVK